ncbi:MAG: hypothetical protein CSA55_01315 [Ilumatobacter coccineus]|uniref:Rieske domain-containing protein n=1 Tax=Ilumatobacter coccineus TaxID=467094 RepID=A0A2G6KEL3_9ACTN|nr:MAG: hypothetical protein CSA55_01315 [Ilumatobacter coccineus]
MTLTDGIDIGAFDSLETGTSQRFTVEGVDIAVVRIDDEIYALADRCSHADVSLSGGEVWDDDIEIECPRHGSAFCLTTGIPRNLPATEPVQVFDARVIDGRIIISLDRPTSQKEPLS